jgi:ubiquinone/menaquinone biosynthesis C-methylase UbiE
VMYSPVEITIHVVDYLFNYISANMDKNWDFVSIMRVAKSDAHKIFGTMQTAINPDGAKVLDFASGFGRIALQMRTISPLSDLHALDIHPSACRFMRESFGI